MRPKTLSLLLLAVLLLTGSAYAGQDPDGDTPDGDAESRTEIHKVVRFCEEGDEECDEEDVHKIVISGDGAHGGSPHVIHLGGSGLGMAGLHHGLDGAFLGVQLTDLTPELRSHFGVPEDVGVMVSRVVEDSPAFRAGLQVGDVITGVSGVEIASSRSLSTKISRHEDGDTVNLEVWREGGVEQISATLEERSGKGMMSHRIQLGDCAGDDCGAHLAEFSQCAGEEPCRVEVRCEDGDCSCTVNGEPSDCEGLHQGHAGD